MLWVIQKFPQTFRRNLFSQLKVEVVNTNSKFHCESSLQLRGGNSLVEMARKTWLPNRTLVCLGKRSVCRLEGVDSSPATNLHIRYVPFWYISSMQLMQKMLSDRASGSTWYEWYEKHSVSTCSALRHEDSQNSSTMLCSAFSHWVKAFHVW